MSFLKYTIPFHDPLHKALTKDSRGVPLDQPPNPNDASKVALQESRQREQSSARFIARQQILGPSMLQVPSMRIR